MKVAGVVFAKSTIPCLSVCMLMVVFFVTGCASLHTHRIASHPAQLQPAPFVLNGRIAVSFQGAHHSGGLRWSHQETSDEILLLAPLGQTVARITRDARQAVLEQGARHDQAGDLESLMTRVLGWRLPLSGLHDWVLGTSTGGSPVLIERDAQGRIDVLHQDGWEVRYMAYANNQPDSLPSRMQLTHDNLQIKLMIDEWEWGSK